MIKSMTGYGCGKASLGAMTLTVEMKSVNHRFADISIKSPRALVPYDTKIRKMVGKRFPRGKIDIFINQEFEDSASATPTLNKPLAEAYVDLFQEVGRSFPVSDDIPLELLVSQRDVVVLKDAAFDDEDLWGCIEQGLKNAGEALQKMRTVEGEALHDDMEQRIAATEDLLGTIEERAPQVPIEWQAKLTERLKRLQNDFEYDSERVAQEVAIFADRCDITEEVTRFRSHVMQFRDLLDSEEPVGRQMDFLVQELNREANTMGSKSNDADLTRHVVAVKAELEKIKEQVQNVE